MSKNIFSEFYRTKTETSNGVTHTSVYDRASNLRSLTYGETNRVITSTYDARNLLESCSEAIGAVTPRVTEYLYNLNGSITRKTLPNGSYTDKVYDALNRTTSISNYLANATLIQQSVSGYDKANNVTQLLEYTSSATPDQSTSMSYDHVYRLDTETRVEGSDTTVTDHGYDKGNNRTSKAVALNAGAAQITNYQYGTTNDGFNSKQLKSYNRPATSETVTLAYDANGNRATRTIGANIDAFGYDYHNRLVSLDLQSAASSNGLYEYQYDHRTRRVSRDESSAGGDETRVVFSGGLSVQETDKDAGSYDLSAPSVEYVRGSDYGGGVGGVLYTLRDGDSSFNYYNHRGDVILKTDDTGLITWNARYEAFGTRTFEVGSNDDRQKANSKDEDPTGLLNEGFRYRDLETGVFITRDPLGFVDGPNVYTYVRQNPWTFFDPLGLQVSIESSIENDEKGEVHKRIVSITGVLIDTSGQKQIDMERAKRFIENSVEEVYTKEFKHNGKRYSYNFDVNLRIIDSANEIDSDDSDGYVDTVVEIGKPENINGTANPNAFVGGMHLQFSYFDLMFTDYKQENPDLKNVLTKGLRRTLAHEMGHVMGLHHPSNKLLAHENEKMGFGITGSNPIKRLPADNIMRYGGGFGVEISQYALIRHQLLNNELNNVGDFKERFGRSIPDVMKEAQRKIDNMRK